MVLLSKSVSINDYQEIKQLIGKTENLILDNSIVKKLESIFDADPSVIESKIISETTTHYSNQSETGRFLFFIKHSLLAFTSNFEYRNPKIFDCEISERTFIVECLSPIFKSFRNAFPEVKYDWIEKEVDSIKIANKMFMTQARLRKTDLLVTHLVDGKEIVDVEVSGPPYNPQESHTVGDIKKLLMMAVCNLCCIFGNDLNCKIEDAKKIKSFSIQVIGDRLTLFSVSLFDRRKYLAVELASCIIPFSLDSIVYFLKIFNFFQILKNEIFEQKEFRKKIMINTPEEDKMKVQDWLHFPDPSLKPLPDFLDAITI
ncbi:9512_t:CDS:2 [Entrophospora sp. SA101]|nr:9512_t:CDS:2 [Entrophospora sp. SA101]